jgi:F-type H+-transporting ATPase subunit b
MELDTTSFLLEVMNFVILVWILKRFLYRPILGVIDRRRNAIEDTLKHAAALKDDAARLREQCDTRLRDWEQEKAAALATLNKEMAELKTKRLADIGETARREQERLAILEQRREAEQSRMAEQRALELSVMLTARMLERLSGPALEAKLIDVMAADMKQWPPEQVDKVAAATRAVNGRIEVTTAFALPDEARQSLQHLLSERLGVDSDPVFLVDSSLIAGLRIAVGPWLLQANLRDELGYFSHGATHAA